jgi:hypothetical protein
MESTHMTRFYQPDSTVNVDSPFIRDGNDKLIRRLDTNDRALVCERDHDVASAPGPLAPQLLEISSQTPSPSTKGWT